MLQFLSKCLPAGVFVGAGDGVGKKPQCYGTKTAKLSKGRFFFRGCPAVFVIESVEDLEGMGESGQHAFFRDLRYLAAEGRPGEVACQIAKSSQRGL